jgi:lincosamide nucleotidyltransferase
MTSLVMQDNLRQHILHVVQADPRIVGCVDYGSTSEGRGDEWSDLDIALFIRDDELDLFEKDWKQWASQFGNLLLAYIGGVGHPWAVYDTDRIPLRVDFVFHPASTLNRVLEWPNSPTSTDAMVWHDLTDGKLTAFVNQIVGQSLAPDNLEKAFEQVGGDFWYYFLRTQAKLMRGENWAARHDFSFIITGNLLALLRIECAAVSHWRASSAAVGIEKVLSEQRLNQLNQCIPGSSSTDLRAAMFRAASLGYQVSEEIAQKYGWGWPISLAKKVLAILE